MKPSPSLRSHVVRKHVPAPRLLLGLMLASVAGTARAESRAYVARSGAQLVSIVDVESASPLGAISVGQNPSGVAVTADGARAYVSNAGSDSVSVIDTRTGAVTGTIPVGDGPSRVAVSPDGSRAYVMLAAGVVEVIDTSLAAVVASIPVGGNGGGGIAFTPDGSRAYVAAGAISVVDVATSTITTSFPPETAPVQDVSHTAVSVAISPDGARAWVARVTFDFTGGDFSASGGVVVVDTASDTVVASVGTGSLPGAIDVTPDGSRLYVALVSTWVDVGTAQGFLPAKIVAAIDTATLGIVGWIHTANTPSGVSVVPDGSAAWVTIPAAGSVAVIATATNTISTSVPLAGSPGGIELFELPEPTITVYCAGDGSGTACPCGNASPPGAGEGCLHSFGLGGKLRASGVARISDDTLTLEGSQMPDTTALYFQGTLAVGNGAGVVFADGLRCAGGEVIRLGAKSNSGGASQYPAAGDPSISVKGLVTVPGSIRTYQAWYRNPIDFCSSEPSNFSNGIEVRWEL